jgi:hypothetical protein
MDRWCSHGIGVVMNWFEQYLEEYPYLALSALIFGFILGIYVTNKVLQRKL